jgi:hypothetical protein
MWLPLPELILFGGLFIVYAVYRFQPPDAFHLAAGELDTFVGTVGDYPADQQSAVAMSSGNAGREKPSR